MAVTVKRCVDCVSEGIVTKRKLHTYRNGKLVPGPRCATHHRAKRFDRRTYTHAAHILKNYNLTPDEYEAIYEFQGGLCALCRRASGKTKKLSVDHCHKTGVLRGLICGHDNRDVLGHARDQIEFFERCIEYLKNPPAVQVIGERIAPIEAARLTLNEGRP